MKISVIVRCSDDICVHAYVHLGSLVNGYQFLYGICSVRIRLMTFCIILFIFQVQTIIRGSWYNLHQVKTFKRRFYKVESPFSLVMYKGSMEMDRSEHMHRKDPKLEDIAPLHFLDQKKKKKVPSHFSLICSSIPYKGHGSSRSAIVVSPNYLDCHHLSSYLQT